MLIEFQTYQFPPNYDEELYRLVMSGTTPIIAHPERYIPVQKEPDLCKNWIDRGIMLQLDCGSILGHFGHRCEEISKELIKLGCIQIIGSDAHNNRTRNFCLKTAHKKIASLFGFKIVEKLKYHSSLLLDGKKLEIIGPIDFINNNRTEKSIINRFMKAIKWER